MSGMQVLLYLKFAKARASGLHLVYIWENEWREDKNTVLSNIMLGLTGKFTLSSGTYLTTVNGSFEGWFAALSGFTLVEEGDPSFSWVSKNQLSDRTEEKVKTSQVKIWDAGTTFWVTKQGKI